MPMSQSATSNILLARMSGDDYRRLQPDLVRVALPLRYNLHNAGDLIEQVYFPESGVVSIISKEHDGKQIEVGFFGREGMSGSAAVLGTDQSPFEAYVQIAGASALCIATPVLQQAMRESPTLTSWLLRYVQTTLVQTASSITSAAGYSIEQRLARWLLMCHDRVDGNALYLTQDFMAMMLGSRRPSVMAALHILEAQHLITSRRRSVTICNRPGLEEASSGSYGFAESEYGRLIGAALRRGSTERNSHLSAA